MSKLTFLVIHCTATPELREVTSDEIRHWHMDPPPKGRGWHQVGYTNMIHLNGAIEQLVGNNDDDWVDPWEITNGVAGINHMAQHIVYVGGMDKAAKVAKDTRTKEQVTSMTKFVRQFVIKHPHILIAGHNQFAPKACPSFSVPMFLQLIGVPAINIYHK